MESGVSFYFMGRQGFNLKGYIRRVWSTSKRRHHNRQRVRPEM